MQRAPLSVAEGKGRLHTRPADSGGPACCLQGFAACQKIRTTPMPFPYVQMLNIYLLAICYTLSLTIVHEYTYITPIVNLVIVATIFGLNAIGVEIEVCAYSAAASLGSQLRARALGGVGGLHAAHAAAQLLGHRHRSECGTVGSDGGKSSSRSRDNHLQRRAWHTRGARAQYRAGTRGRNVRARRGVPTSTPPPLPSVRTAPRAPHLPPHFPHCGFHLLGGSRLVISVRLSLARNPPCSIGTRETWWVQEVVSVAASFAVQMRLVSPQRHKVAASRFRFKPPWVLQPPSTPLQLRYTPIGVGYSVITAVVHPPSAARTPIRRRVPSDVG